MRACKQTSRRSSAPSTASGWHRVQPCHVLVLQGGYFLARPALAAACNLKVYLDTDADELLTRFIRRHEGRESLSALLETYLQHVKPEREARTEPLKGKADFVLCNFDGHAKSLADMTRQFPIVYVLKEYLRARLSQQELEGAKACLPNSNLKVICTHSKHKSCF